MPSCSDLSVIQNISVVFSFVKKLGIHILVFVVWFYLFCYSLINFSLPYLFFLNFEPSLGKTSDAKRQVIWRQIRISFKVPLIDCETYFCNDHKYVNLKTRYRCWLHNRASNHKLDKSKVLHIDYIFNRTLWLEAAGDTYRVGIYSQTISQDSQNQSNDHIRSRWLVDHYILKNKWHTPVLRLNSVSSKAEYSSPFISFFDDEKSWIYSKER